MAKSPNLNELNVPPEFSGPGQLLLYTRYGDPRDAGFEQKWMNLWDVKKEFPWFPVRDIYIHKHFRPMLEEAFKELSVMGLQDELKTCDGCFDIRMLSGGNQVLSIHSWGAAIDLNAKDNPLGSFGKWSDSFIAIMEKHDICCGQSWNGRRDPMHFAMING